MENNYYGIATTPTDDYLAHYGVKGMKWGVRKALERGSDKALSRQYSKAQKKLAKLEKRASSGKKYAKRAAALGLGAAAAGGIAATGTKGIAAVTRGAGQIGGGAVRGAGLAAQKLSGVMRKAGIRGAGKLASAGGALQSAGLRAQAGTSGAAKAVEAWGRGKDVGKAVGKTAGNAIVGGADLAYKAGARGVGSKALGLKSKAMSKAGSISNSGYTRLAGAALGAGLAGLAGYNAYRAATTKRAAKKAAQFRSEMNKTFAGTKYANAPRTPQKKRRR